MRNTTRFISVTAMGLMAGVAIGAGPAQASGTATQPDAKAGTQQHIGRDDVVGYFHTLPTCEIAGRIGERQGQWDYYDCDIVRIGFGGGGWRLTVERDRGWMHNGHHSSGKPQDDSYGKPKDDKVKDDKADGYGKPKDDKVKDDKADGYGKPKDDKVKDDKADAYGEPMDDVAEDDY